MPITIGSFPNYPAVRLTAGGGDLSGYLLTKNTVRMTLIDVSGFAFFIRSWDFG
ncbi:hypothetical protein SAMN05192553_101224 [Cyclobacterium xiamenense]|uniref:Uncharacterized protein n=1 Tax=Cyclobacterium xiamenense TaxID=1297121 RepID=A0A1H6TMC9_9BACT|nr:hypothetical protein SAMN05192553_101224 [Cyclobacterium xiamenense]